MPPRWGSGRAGLWASTTTWTALDAAEVLDLGGATVTPGFIDAHCHTTWFGLGLGELDVSAARGLNQLYALLEAGMAADSARPEAGPEPGTGPAPDWLLATGFSQQQHGGEFPDITVLDRITGNRPLFMRHNSGHMAVVNTAALRLAGAEPASFPDPDGGVIVRDADGRPTGLVQETAQQLIQQLILPYSSEAIEAALDRATSYYAAEGITSFTEAGIGGGWIGHSPVELAAYQRAASAGRLHARAQLMPVLDVLHPLGGQHPPDAAPAGLDLGIASGFGGDFLSLGPAKVFLDGSLLGETAAVSQDYCSHGGTDNTGNTGYFQAEPDALRAKIEAAYAAGWSIAAHAIGDRAVDLAIDIITGCAAKYGPRAVPNRIEHASMTRPEQLQRLAAADIAVTPQASFFADGGDGMTLSLGPERLGWAYRAASFLCRRCDARRQLRPPRGGRKRAPRHAGLRGPAHRLRGRFREPGRAAEPAPGPGGVHHRSRRSHRHLRHQRLTDRREAGRLHRPVRVPAYRGQHRRTPGAGHRRRGELHVPDAPASRPRLRSIRPQPVHSSAQPPTVHRGTP